MELTVATRDSYVIGTTTGVIDETAGDVFGQQLRPLVAQRAKVVLDISGSPRINSAGIASLVRLVTDANKGGGRVILAAPAPFVAQVFDVTKLYRFFEIVDSVQQAEQRLAEDG